MSVAFTLLYLALAMCLGLFMTRLMKIVHLPNVTGYLIVGILIGPFLLGLIYKPLGLNVEQIVNSISVISTVALGFIAFSIGGEFKLKNIRKIGGKVITITFCQAFLATFLVDLGLIVFFFIKGNGHLLPSDLPIALTLGAIATATAPAATLMVVRQYKAHGPVVESLLPVVAFDDAIGLMIFSISFAISKVLITGDALSFKTAFLDPILEIIFSLAIGIALGFILSFSIRLFKSRANRLGLMIMSVIAGVGFAKWLNLSDLLICMMIGAVFCNMRTDSEKILEGTDRWTPPLFMLFFIISGADLKINVLFNIAIISIAVVYILCRSLGKYFGAAFGAKVTKSHPNIIKYLGLTLLPQAGVAIGMASIVKNNAIAGNFDMDAATTIQTVVLFATLVYELIGPVITKIALIKAGEIDVPDKKESIPETNNNQVITNIEEPKK